MTITRLLRKSFSGCINSLLSRTVRIPSDAKVPAKIKQILQRIDEAITQTALEVRAYIKEHRGFSEIGERMLKEWEPGSALSLRSA